MSRYIDADKILYKDLSEGRGVCWVTFMDWIKEMPTADVVEVDKAQKEIDYWHDKAQSYEQTILKLSFSLIALAALLIATAVVIWFLMVKC